MQYDFFKESAAFSIDLQSRDFPTRELTHALPRLAGGRYGFHITFDSNRYPLRQHFCYLQTGGAAAQDSAPARRFAEMCFSATPPGIAVGPWPGWRGIPEMPAVLLTIGNETNRGHFNFWGDELNIHRCRVLVFAEINGEQEFHLAWTDSRLVPIQVQIYAAPNHQPAPLPVALRPELQQVYPRLLFSAAEVELLRIRATSTHRKLWQQIQSLLSNWQLNFTVTAESKLEPGPERLHDMDRVILAGLQSLLTRNPRDVALAKNAFFNFLTAVLRPGFEPMQIDTQSGECLFTLCLGYDWLQEFMTTAELALAQDQLFAAAELVWRHLGYDRTDYAQAHFLGCSHGLLAFSLLFWQEHPRAQEWAAYLRGAFQKVLTMLPADGFYPHGINLWIYEHAFLLRYVELFRHVTGENLWTSTLYWRNCSQFRQAASSPDGLLGITFGDPQYRVGGDAWMHYLIAGRTGAGLAQSLGRRLADLPTPGVDFRNAPCRRRVWEFLFYNPDIAEETGTKQITGFCDGGQIFWRSFSESNSTLLTFRAGPMLGHHRFAAGEWSGYGHSDPGNGGFLIMRNDSFLACGPGPVYRRDTALHNTLTFDGQGQIGDSLPWAPEFIPSHHLAAISASQLYDDPWWIEANLAPAYLPHLGVKRLLRRLYFIAADVLLVYDQIDLEVEREIQWNLHTYGLIDLESTAGALQIRIRDKRETLRVFGIHPDPLSWRSGWSEFVPAYPHDGQRDRFLQLYHKNKQAHFAVLLILGERLPDVQWQQSDEKFCLHIDGKRINLAAV